MEGHVEKKRKKTFKMKLLDFNGNRKKEQV